MEDDPQKNNGKQPKKNEEKKKRRTNKNKKNLFLISLKFRGKPFLGLAQLSKIFHRLKSINFS